VPARPGLDGSDPRLTRRGFKPIHSARIRGESKVGVFVLPQDGCGLGVAVDFSFSPVLASVCTCLFPSFLRPFRLTSVDAARPGLEADGTTASPITLAKNNNEQIEGESSLDKLFRAEKKIVTEVSKLKLWLGSATVSGVSVLPAWGRIENGP